MNYDISPTQQRKSRESKAVVKDLLGTAIADNRTEWDLNLKIIRAADNTTVHETGKLVE